MMQVVNQALLEKIGVDDDEIRLRKGLLGFSDEDANLLAEAADHVRPVIGEIVQEFFEQLAEQAEVSHFSISGDTFERLRGRMVDYVEKLFCGDYGQEYASDRLKIGLIHQQTGVEPKLFIAAMKGIKAVLRRYISQHIEDKEVGLAVWNALDSVLCLDLMLMLDTYFYSYVSEIRRAKSELEQYAHSLEDMVASRTRELEELSRRDSLTGLYNHRAFTELLRRDLALAIRNNAPLCLVYIDVDDFKVVNDEKGHREGDELLKQLGWVLAAVSRESDIPCRYGGDEFAVILPNSFEPQARMYCERIMEEFHRCCGNITLSFGIAQSGPSEHVDMDTLIRRADELMYSAKRTDGSNIAAIKV